MTAWLRENIYDGSGLLGLFYPSILIAFGVAIVRSQMWDVEVGRLVVCFFDTSGKNLLGRGMAKTMLDKRSNKNILEAMSADARKMEKKIRKSLEKIFKQYPQVTSTAR